MRVKSTITRFCVWFAMLAGLPAEAAPTSIRNGQVSLSCDPDTGRYSVTDLRRDQVVIRKPNAISRNNLLVTYGPVDAPRSIVVGGLTYADFEKFAQTHGGMWFLNHSAYGGKTGLNSSVGAVAEMDCVVARRFLRYSPVAVRLVPDCYDYDIGRFSDSLRKASGRYVGFTSGTLNAAVTWRWAVSHPNAPTGTPTA